MPAQIQEADPQLVSPPRVAVSASPIRFAIPEAAKLLRMSRAQLYNRINDGAIKPHKDGASNVHQSMGAGALCGFMPLMPNDL